MLPLLEQDQWAITFGTGKEFYKIPAQSKLPELEKVALQLSGRNIKFSIIEKKAPAPTAPAAVSTQKEPDVISSEEPFVKADFSAEAQAVATQDTPEEVQSVLNIIEGEMIA